MKTTTLHQTPQPQKAAGFTLIEMMITVAVIGILASIAVPSYREYMQRGHRANARNTLIQAAQWMERAATAVGLYPLPADVSSDVKKVEGGQYNDITVVVNAARTTYTLTATRKPGTGQASDKCGDFVLNQANQRTISNNDSSKTAADCWGR